MVHHGTVLLVFPVPDVTYSSTTDHVLRIHKGTFHRRNVPIGDIVLFLKVLEKKVFVKNFMHLLGTSLAYEWFGFG